MGKEDYYFSLVDYIFFAGMLLISALTGLYFGCDIHIFRTKRVKSIKDYLHGNRQMQYFPVGMSLIAR